MAPSTSSTALPQCLIRWVGKADEHGERSDSRPRSTPRADCRVPPPVVGPFPASRGQVAKHGLWLPRRAAMVQRTSFATGASRSPSCWSSASMSRSSSASSPSTSKRPRRRASGRCGCSGAGVRTRRRRAREPDALANADPAPGEGAASDKDLVARSSFRRISRTNRSSRGRAPFSLGGSDHSPPARRATGYQASSMSSSACRHRSFAVASHAQSRSRHSRRRTRCPVRSAQPASSRS